MQWWRKNRRVVLIVVGAVVVCVAGSYALKLLSIDATAFAAIASAVAAIAAWSSARESSGTARDAIRALSLSSKPDPIVQVYDAEDWIMITVSNNSLHPIQRSRISWKLRNGETGTQDLGFLQPQGLGQWANRGAQYPAIRLPLIDRESGVDEVTLDFWGTNGPVGWRRVQRFRQIYSERNGISSYSVAPEGSREESELA